MRDKKASAAAVSTFADHEVIVPPNRLKKAVERIKPGTKIDFDPVARAEAALAELADDFSVWMDQECTRLDIARNAIKATGITPGNRDVLFRAAHDMKGQAATFGFPQVAPVADSLCRLIEHVPDTTRMPLALVDQHVDAIRAITHKNTRGDGNRYAAQLAEKLRHVTDEFLIRENRDRPEALESILSPSLAPNEPT
jgi:chemotaxis protein histidine kinase CheA